MNNTSLIGRNKIVFTGGGSAGHVTPNLALIGELRKSGWAVDYIGSAEGIERGIVEGTGIPFHAISSGKLRRYIDLKNLSDPFKVVKGVWDAWRVLGRVKPDVVFSKGGFVTVPVVIAAKLRGIPVLIHESDITPGLANRISVPLAGKVCVNFPETVKHIKGNKAVYTGLPIRRELFAGKADKARMELDFVRTRPVVLVMGGSLGAKSINQAVREALPELLQDFQVIHICGKGNVDEALAGRRGYKQVEFITVGLADMLALADVAVSRAGATSIFEFLALRKPMLLIPLSRNVSRGDQVLNAESFARRGFAQVLEEEELNAETLLARVRDLYTNRSAYAAAMEQEAAGFDATGKIVGLIREAAESRK
ncbi:undecaprenyldiphospho-muramoylpentapeptide beta-N-acetylglucosaminyltransferase [Paenibacillus sp. YN15]|uniref:undecaprenyldiphospho-muramoylpentapeptide beta-N-acetylglucosaminyltransferase n=1 Tax=Paenibacillus sp. YN15 TaxID=1742774 RepID=UPI000DCBC6D8|nr:undecaprenyldiphospho-muramoylpentapeptide beta-N-acetylglucosaminyltransferase [Paenibacillus sp. YN15]RAU99158.1 undecaprenyldiphospho-muramoylpentapeptide beta-N-acetylglucosaminyltransferase [Paenibacillus sp. YN15]